MVWAHLTTIVAIHFTVLAWLLAVQAESNEGTQDHEHAQALKDFVPDHPHLHDLVDKTGEGDAEAKLKFERESLAARCKCAIKTLLWEMRAVKDL